MKMIHIAEDMSMDQELRLETTHTTLNKQGFVRAADADSQWILLVNEGLSHIGLSPADYAPMRDYLVKTLGRFVNDTGFFQLINGFSLWQRALRPEGMSQVMVQQVADIGLLYITVFRRYAEYRHNVRSIRFSADLTEHMYCYLAQERSEDEDWESIALQSMSEHFGLSIMALRAISNMSGQPVELDLHQEALRFPSDTEVASDIDDINLFAQMVCVSGNEDDYLVN